MTALELKASLLQTISDIDDQTIIQRINNYVRNVLSRSEKKPSNRDLTIDPDVMAIVSHLNSISSDNDREEYRMYLEEKYK